MGTLFRAVEQCHCLTSFSSQAASLKKRDGGRSSSKERRVELSAEGVYLRMEKTKGKGGGTAEVEGEAGQEEGDQGRAGEETQPAEEGGGGEAEKRGGREEGQGGWGEEEE